MEFNVIKIQIVAFMYFICIFFVFFISFIFTGDNHCNTNTHEHTRKNKGFFPFFPSVNSFEISKQQYEKITLVIEKKNEHSNKGTGQMRKKNEDEHETKKNFKFSFSNNSFFFYNSTLKSERKKIKIELTQFLKRC